MLPPECRWQLPVLNKQWATTYNMLSRVDAPHCALEFLHCASWCCRFELQEVRYDSKKYPYLLLSTVKDWQDCTGNPSQEGAGFPCLAQTAAFPEVAALTKKQVINIIVGGSIFPKWCNGTEAESCSSLYSGYTGSIGPW